jgi:hypothetical protein
MFGDTKAKLVMVECREHASNAAVHIVDGGVSNMVMSIDGSEAAKQIQGAADEAVRRIQEATGVYNVG